MTFERLQELYYQGQTEDFIRGAESFLIDHPSDIDVLVLLAIAYFHLDADEPGSKQYETLNTYSLPYLQKVLAIDPKNPQALISYIDLSIRNDYYLMDENSDLRNINENTAERYVDYANKLIHNEQHIFYGYQFLAEIHNLLDNKELKLNTLSEGLDYLAKNPLPNRQNNDSLYSSLWIKKIYLLRDYPDFSFKELSQLVDQGFGRFASEEDEQYVDLIEIAFQANDIDLALRILTTLIDINNSDEYIIDHFVRWHHQIVELVDNGLHSPVANYFLLIVERNYFEALDIEEEYYYSHALEILESSPEDYGANHFAGTYLFENEDYQEAIPYLKKAMDKKGFSVTVKRFLESNLYIHHKIPGIPQLKDNALDRYNAATDLFNLSNEIDIPEFQHELLLAAKNIYQQAQDAFEQYFEENMYESTPVLSYHCWAMNCNNYGIVLNNLEEYRHAAAVTEEGLQYSDFWELHSTLIEAYIESEDYPNAKIALDRFFETYTIQDIPFLNFLLFEADRIEVEYNLSPSPDLEKEARMLLFQIYDYGLANPEMSDYDYRDFESAKVSIQSICFKFVENQTVDYKIEIYEAIAKKYPEESNPAFMLMQFYMEKEEHLKSAENGLKYLKNKRDFMIDSFDRVRTNHYIMKSFVRSGEYQKALPIYQESHLMAKDELEDTDYTIWLMNAIILHHKLDYTDVLIKLIKEYKDIYQENNWEFDEDIESVLLIEAELFHKQENSKEAHRILDYILSQNSDSSKAKEYKKSWKKPGFFSKLRF